MGIINDNKKKKQKQSSAEKPISLKPLNFDEAVSDLLKVKPEFKPKPKKEEVEDKKEG
jgi:hypothetical protein